MSSHFHRQVILEEVFGESSIFPLSIVLPETEVRPEMLQKTCKLYHGVHFLSTDTILSIRYPKPARIIRYFDKEGNPLQSPLHPKTAFKLDSIEIAPWCEGIASGTRSSYFCHCDAPYIFKDTEFDSFIRVAMKFPGFTAFMENQDPNRLYPPTEELIRELDEELLRLRRMLF